jgi:hypothetical protein
MRELTNTEIQAVSGGAAAVMRPPVGIDVRRIIIAVLERIIARLGGDGMRRVA